MNFALMDALKRPIKIQVMAKFKKQPEFNEEAI